MKYKKSYGRSIGQNSLKNKADETQQHVIVLKKNNKFNPYVSMGSRKVESFTKQSKEEQAMWDRVDRMLDRVIEEGPQAESIALCSDKEECKTNSNIETKPESDKNYSKQLSFSGSLPSNKIVTINPPDSSSKVSLSIHKDAGAPQANLDWLGDYESFQEHPSVSDIAPSQATTTTARRKRLQSAGSVLKTLVSQANSERKKTFAFNNEMTFSTNDFRNANFIHMHIKSQKKTIEDRAEKIWSRCKGTKSCASNGSKSASSELAPSRTSGTSNTGSTGGTEVSHRRLIGLLGKSEADNNFPGWRMKRRCKSIGYGTYYTPLIRYPREKKKRQATETKELATTFQKEKDTWLEHYMLHLTHKRLSTWGGLTLN